MERLLSMEEAERGCRRLVVQLLSYQGIDVTGEHVNVSLIKAIKGTPFRKDHTDKLMVSLDVRLLMRRGRIAVEQAGSFNSGRIMLNGYRV